MRAKTVGFAIADEDRELLDRLVAKYGDGNRSEFLRKAMQMMAKVEFAERFIGPAARIPGEAFDQGLRDFARDGEAAHVVAELLGDLTAPVIAVASRPWSLGSYFIRMSFITILMRAANSVR